jgi:RNA polymerase sigma-70 factor (ECF subfamily)
MTAVPQTRPIDLTSGFEPFFEEHRPGLFRALVVLTGDPSEAEELMQEAFFRVWERWGRVRDLENPAGYLHRTAVNLFRSRYRRARYVAKRRLHLASEVVDPLAQVEHRDSALRALSRLTPRQRAAVVTTVLLGYDVSEAAALLGIRPGTVRTLVSQARERLSRKEGVPG